MSVTIQNIILDAKRLAGRLKTREAAGDSLIKITQSLSKQIDIIKQVSIFAYIQYYFYIKILNIICLVP